MPTIFGIVNCTPDSFSDGIGSLSHDTWIARGRQLIDDGADVLDIGGDSTRPGSRCVGPQEEWRRIEPVLRALAHEIPCSVDTHSVEVAERALSAGAKLINDVSGTLSRPMVIAVREADASYVAMCNPHRSPHSFGQGLSLANAIAHVRDWMARTADTLLDMGLSPRQITLDPGMGAFLGKDPAVSWLLLEHLEEILPCVGGLMLGCSRKGFLRQRGESCLADRDEITALVGVAAAQRVGNRVPLCLRVHNVALQLQSLRAPGSAPSLASLAARCE